MRIASQSSNYYYVTLKSIISIQIHLPDDLASQVFRLTNNVENFIIDMLRSQMKESNLAAEYRLANQENSQLLQDFAIVDLEGWENDY